LVPKTVGWILGLIRYLKQIAATLVVRQQLNTDCVLLSQYFWHTWCLCCNTIKNNVFILTLYVAKGSKGVGGWWLNL